MKSFKMIVATSLISSILFSSTFIVNADVNNLNVEIDNSIPTHDFILNESFDPNVGVGGFVARLYRCVFGRSYDADGFNTWCNLLSTGELDGANCARGFFYSNEFITNSPDIDEYITILYRVFFDRAPDPDGFNTWKGMLENGYSYQEILEYFINSTEWANVCLSYGIRSGGNAAPTITPPISDGIRTFVNSLYSDFMGRTADPDGFNTWAGVLARMQMTGKEVASGFVHSPEFVSRFASMSNDERVRVFYRVFLDREPDPDGYTTWIAVLNNGGTIDTLFNGFCDSPEFAQKCARSGIMASRNTTSSVVFTTSYNTFCVDIGNGQQQVITGYFDVAAENAIFSNTNSLRSSLGKNQLTHDGTIREYARIRAVELAASYSHTRPNGTSCFTVVQGNRGGMAENIAYASYKCSGTEFYNAWRNSSGHYRNMTGNYNNIGVGYFVDASTGYAYATQLFTQN